jgi:hypothetical protein
VFLFLAALLIRVRELFFLNNLLFWRMRYFLLFNSSFNIYFNNFGILLLGIFNLWIFFYSLILLNLLFNYIISLDVLFYFLLYYLIFLRTHINILFCTLYNIFIFSLYCIWFLWFNLFFSTFRLLDFLLKIDLNLLYFLLVYLFIFNYDDWLFWFWCLYLYNFLWWFLLYLLFFLIVIFYSF